MRKIPARVVCLSLRFELSLAARGLRVFPLIRRGTHAYVTYGMEYICTVVMFVRLTWVDVGVQQHECVLSFALPYRHVLCCAVICAVCYVPCAVCFELCFGLWALCCAVLFCPSLTLPYLILAYVVFCSLLSCSVLSFLFFFSIQIRPGDAIPRQGERKLLLVPPRCGGTCAG